jgi:photosystem II stability/assembly factor-like uncharacterized protein
MAINCLAVDPQHPDTLLAGTYGAGVYLSRDAGHGWVPANSGIGKGTVGTLAIDPNDPSRVYAALFDQGGVYRSRDGGQTWESANSGIDLSGAWNWTGLINIDPTDSTHLYYTGTTNGFYESRDAGETWVRREEVCPQVTALAIDPADGNHLYAATYQHPDGQCSVPVYESEDSGATWTPLAGIDAADDDWWHIATDPDDFETIYAGGWNELYRSQDGGQSWASVRDGGCNWLAAGAGGVVYCGQGGPLLISRDRGASWEEHGLGEGRGGAERLPFAIDPKNPDTLYAAGIGHVWRSTNRGREWSRMGRIDAMDRIRLTVDPRDGNRIFAVGADGYASVLRSTDRGRTWQETGVDGWDGRLSIDAAANVVYYPDASQTLYRSRDSGATWETFGTGYLTRGPWQLEADPTNSNRLWLAGECGSRLAVSTDNGATFSPVASLSDELCQPILLVGPTGRRIYVVRWGAAFRSSDRGRSWSRLGDLPGIPRSAALDPADPDVLYVGLTSAGAMKLSDGGDTIESVNTGLDGPSVRDLAIDPEDSRVVYAATVGGIFVSVDAGGSWWRLGRGLGSDRIAYAVAVDPSDPGRVYAATPHGLYELAGGRPRPDE